MNVPAIERYVEQLVSLTKPPDQRRRDERGDSRDREESEVGFQSELPPAGPTTELLDLQKSFLVILKNAEHLVALR